MLYYHEVFPSIQGESTDVGLPTVFVRLYGCNLDCGYCDQPQKPSDRKRISAENLIREVKKYGITNVCITGGEPLLQQEIYVVIYSLLDDGLKVSIETNGSVEIPQDCYLRNYKYVMDIKCPSSGQHLRNKFENLANLHDRDEVKFVIADRGDYEFAKKVMRDYPSKALKIMSPMFDYENRQSIGAELSDWLIEDRLSNTRIGLQIHKFLEVR